MTNCWAKWYLPCAYFHPKWSQWYSANAIIMLWSKLFPFVVDKYRFAVPEGNTSTVYQWKGRTGVIPEWGLLSCSLLSGQMLMHDEGAWTLKQDKTKENMALVSQLGSRKLGQKKVLWTMIAMHKYQVGLLDWSIALTVIPGVTPRAPLSFTLGVLTALDLLKLSNIMFNINIVRRTEKSSWYQLWKCSINEQFHGNVTATMDSRINGQIKQERIKTIHPRACSV